MTDFAKDVQERFKAAEEADKDNRDEAELDLKFLAGDQWDPEVRQDREEGDDYRPCLTINQMPQFIEQVVGDFIGNAQTIRFLPKEDADTDLAEVRTELMRSIMVQSDAETMLMEVLGHSAACGRSHFRVDLDYASDDVFDQDIFLRGIPNPLAVLADPLAVDGTLKDASYVFVNDKMPKDEFKKQYPDAGHATLEVNSSSTGTAGWIDDNTVRVAEMWRMEEVERTLAMFNDGSIHDVTEQDEAAYREMLFVDQSGNARIRKSPVKTASMVMTNGQEELSDPFTLRIPRVPIIRCSGHRVWVGDKRVEFGLVRFARDPQRLKNLFRSFIAERLVKAPIDNFIGPASAFEGREDDWADSRIYNDKAPFAPQDVSEKGMQGLMAEAQNCSQDMKDVTGLHDASLGMLSNETSGVAIRGRQQQGDIATARYHSNLRAGLREAGEVINAMIPIVYDTPRTIRLLGEDMGAKLIRVNDESDPQSIDLSKGRYDITVDTGPAYLTARQEVQASIVEAGRNGAPLWERAGDLVAKALDWPNAEEFAKRFAPPGMADEDDPEAAQKAQQAQQLEAMAAQLEMRAKQADTAEKEASAMLKQAQAMKAQADAKRAMAEAEKAEAETREIETDQVIKGAHLAEEMATEDDIAGEAA